MTCGEDLLDTNKFSVTRAIERTICVVHTAADDGGGGGVHEDAADGGFVVGEGMFGLVRLVFYWVIVTMMVV